MLFQEIKEVNVFTAWRQLLEENEKISKARLAAVQVLLHLQSKIENNCKSIFNIIQVDIYYFSWQVSNICFQVYIEDVEKDTKALKASKQAQTKKCLERIQTVQKDLQESISEVRINQHRPDIKTL